MIELNAPKKKRAATVRRIIEILTDDKAGGFDVVQLLAEYGKLLSDSFLTRAERLQLEICLVRILDSEERKP